MADMGWGLRVNGVRVERYGEERMELKGVLVEG